MLTLTIDGVDFTSTWRLYESEWSSRAYMGESIQSRFVIDDPDGTIDHLDLASKKIVEVWEDASGSPVCMYRGRVANKTLGRYQSGRVGMAMRWTVTAEDYNIDFDGLRVDESTRNGESDYARVLGYAAGYLAGSSSTNDNARDSTDLGTTYVINSDNVTMEAETYTDIYVRDVFQRICEQSAKTFFAFVDEAGDGQLYYGMHADTTYASTISITDDSVAGGADEVDVYTAYYNEQAGNHDGQHVISGGSMRYGADQFYEYSDPTSEGFHDKWEEHFQDETITTAFTADRVLKAIINSRNNEDFTYIATIDMRADQAHRIRAGMSVPLRLVAADLPTETDQRAVQVTHVPQHPDEDGEAWYRVIVELGVPRGRPFQRGPRSKPGPFSPTPTTPPGPDTPGSSVWSYSWNFESNNLDTGTGTVHFMLGRENAPGTLTSWWGSSGGGSNSGLYEKQAVTAGGSLNINGRFAKNRLSTLSTSFLTIRWFANITDVNYTSSTTVPIGPSGSKPGVFATVANSTTVPVGIGAVRIDVDNNLFADDLTISHTGAATPGTAGVAGNGLVELTGTSNVYAPIDHRDGVERLAAPTITDDEEHGYPVGTEWRVVDDTDNPTVVYERWVLLDNTDGAAVWVIDLSGDASTVPYDGALTELAAENVQDAIDELEDRIDDLETITGTDEDNDLTNTGGEAAKLVTVADAGAAYEVNLDGGNAFDLTLTEACTVTFAGLTNARLCEWTIYWRGSFGITWPSSVVWAEGSAPDAPTSGKYHVVKFQSIDGGTNVEATYGGSGSASSLDDLSDVTISTPSDGQVLTYDSSTSEWVNENSAAGFSNPMTTAGDIIIGGASGAAARLAIGTAAQVLTVNAGATAPEWAAATGGGSLTQAYVGKNAIGASTEAMVNRRMYAIKVTLANACLITDIEAYATNDTGQVTSFNVALLDDNAGSPGEIIAFAGVTTANQLFLGAAVSRWLGSPIGYWATAGDYWLAVQMIDSNADLNFAKDASGGTCAHWTATGDWLADGSASTVTTTSEHYSIRANTIR